MYTNIRKKLNKFVDGGKIPKMQTSFLPMPGLSNGLSDGNGKIWNAALKLWILDPNAKLSFGLNLGTGNFPSAGSASQEQQLLELRDAGIDEEDFAAFLKDSDYPAQQSSSVPSVTVNATPGALNDGDVSLEYTDAVAGGGAIKMPNTNIETYLSNGAVGAAAVFGVNADQATGHKRYVTDKNGNVKVGKDGKPKTIGLSANGEVALGAASAVAAKGFQMADQAFMGDKNFGAQSEAIDGAVHTASGALMKSGNPYAIAAGAALEGINFLTKAGGQTVQGFDVDINNSGYGNLGHMESSSSRSLFGIGNGHLKEKLARRNEQARMALTAAEISADSSFELEARMNSVENTIMNNQIALSGGLETNMLAG